MNRHITLLRLVIRSGHEHLAGLRVDKPDHVGHQVRQERFLCHQVEDLTQLSIPKQQVLDVVGVVHPTPSHCLLLHLLVGDFSLQLLELLDEHVVKGVEVLGQFSRSSSPTHPLERQLLLFLEPDLVRLFVQRFIIDTLCNFDYVLLPAFDFLVSSRRHFFISPVDHHFPHILCNVGLQPIYSCQVLTIGHVQCDAFKLWSFCVLEQVDGFRFYVPESASIGLGLLVHLDAFVVEGDGGGVPE